MDKQYTLDNRQNSVCRIWESRKAVPDQQSRPGRVRIRVLRVRGQVSGGTRDVWGAGSIPAIAGNASVTPRAARSESGVARRNDAPPLAAPRVPAEHVTRKHPVHVVHRQPPRGFLAKRGPRSFHRHAQALDLARAHRRDRVFVRRDSYDT